jgi:hypothetical protein
VKKSFEYRRYAEECHALAKRMPPGEQRDSILTIARIWEQLALVRANRAQAAAASSPQERASAVGSPSPGRADCERLDRSRSS